MQFTAEINRLLVGMMILFGVVALAAGYWAVVGADTILLRDDNPRRVEAQAAILRGSILDRNAHLLAESTAGETRAATRRYSEPAAAGALGYYSLRYGTAGIEAGYDALLRGDSLEQGAGDALADILLHRPQQGTDLQLTLDIGLQQQLADAMSGQQGAAVLLSVPDGAVLALVSLPTYDPNTLDADWDRLRTDPGNPFFNRAVQGLYQPGGVLQTPLIASAIVYGIPLDTAIPEAALALRMSDGTLRCASPVPAIPLSLREAYAYACPSAFARLALLLGSASVRETFETFSLYQPPTLPGYDAPAPAQPTPLDFRDLELRRSGVGQSKLTISPLTAATIAAGILNDGNAPTPSVLLATRAPDSEIWQPAPLPRPTTPIATTATARQVQELMRASTRVGAAQNAQQADIDIGGHASLAYSGDGTQAWFIGFVSYGGRSGAAIAVILEDSDDPALAAHIGGTVLAAAAAD